MYLKLLYCVSVVLYLSSVADCSKAPFVTKCTALDSVCMKKSANELIPTFIGGIPELGVETMDPMYIDRVDASTPFLKLILTNSTLTGLKNCIVHEIERDLVEAVIRLTAECTSRLTGNYEINGKVLFLTMQGEGDSIFDFNKAFFKITYDFTETIGQDGKTYFQIKSNPYKLELRAQGGIVLHGLFKNNEFLRRTSEELLRVSANQIILDLGAPTIDYIVDRIFSNLQQFFAAIPAEDLALQ